MDSHKEQKWIAEMQSILQTKMEKDYPVGKTRRDAHPKSLGLVKAEFTVLDNIPQELKQGVFAKPANYKAWIRFSNASGKIQSDKQKDFRGIGMKLMGVEGERFTTDEKHSQDFLLMTNPTMPLGTVKLFRDAVYYSIKVNPLILVLKLLFTGHADVLKTLSTGKKNDTSPLDITYWSTVPYKLGDKVMKYKMVPASTFKSNLPAQLTDNYLTENMQQHLQQKEASFDFYIQLFRDEKTTPIEDAGVEWKPEDSPFIKVAEVKIPVQQFDTDERKELAEQFSFSPANALLVHEPLGGINRARIAIYKALSKFRHQRDGKLQKEPWAEEFDNTK